MKQEPCPSVHDSRYQRVRCCLEYIHKEYAGRLRLEDIARAANVSVSECCRDFKEVLSQSPVDYLISYRVRMGEYMLAHSDKSVLEIALAVGFSGSSHFSNTFCRYMGCTPLYYRKHLMEDREDDGNKGMEAEGSLRNDGNGKT